ncbi:MAG: O-antigen ligase family protein [Pseudonocardiaceae bacterium]
MLLGSRPGPMPLIAYFLVRSPERYGLPRLGRPNIFLLLVTAFLALQFLIPANLVISGLGAAGRPSVVIALGFSLIWLASWFSTQAIPVGFQPVRWFVTAYFATSVLAYAVGYTRGLSQAEARGSDRQLIFIIAMCGLAFAIADGVPDRRTLDAVLRRLTHFSGVMAAVGAIQALFRVNLTNYIRIPHLQANDALIGIGERGDQALARVSGTASHYIEFGVVLAMVTPIAVHYALQSAGRSQQIRRWGLTLLILSGVPFSISRSAVLSLAVALGVLAVAWTWRTRISALIVGVVATAAFRAFRPGVLGTILSLFENAGYDPSVQHRTDDYPIIERYFFDRPWLGRGLATFLPRLYIQVDNEFLVTLVCGGLVALAAFVTLFVGGYFVGRSIRHHGTDDSTRHLGQALAASLAAALVASGTFDAMSFPTFVGVIFLLLGALGALFRLRRATDLSPTASHPRSRRVESLPPVLCTTLGIRWQRLLEAVGQWIRADGVTRRQHDDG